jgi:hypothetical protein
MPETAVEELVGKWKQQMEIVYQQTIELFSSRHRFHTITKMFETNPALAKSGQHIWLWIRALYYRDLIMMLRRHLDKQNKATSLTKVMYEVADHAPLLTRAWFHRERDYLQNMPSLIDRAFEAMGGPPGPGQPEDHLDPACIRADIAALTKATDTTVAFGHRVLAHLVDTDRNVEIAEVADALKAWFACFKRYFAFITASDLPTPTPVPQFDWLEPFRLAWIAGEFEEPRDEFTW